MNRSPLLSDAGKRWFSAHQHSILASQHRHYGWPRSHKEVTASVSRTASLHDTLITIRSLLHQWLAAVLRLDSTPSSGDLHVNITAVPYPLSSSHHKLLTKAKSARIRLKLY
jgi:hypothetical protein